MVDDAARLASLAPPPPELQPRSLSPPANFANETTKRARPDEQSARPTGPLDINRTYWPESTLLPQPVMTSVLLGRESMRAPSRAVTVTEIEVPGAGRGIRVPVVPKQYEEQVGTL
jgi:hypothetical protein